MMFIIDGTGETDDTTYMADMERGFCKQLSLKLGKQAKYMRGPRVDGLNTFDIVTALDFSSGLYCRCEPVNNSV
jgi:hypothetical protein